MIVLSEVVDKISNVLNGVDTEISTEFPSYIPVFEYGVQSTGFHLDKISNRNSGKNFIPVFVSQVGGENDPIPGLKKASYVVSIVFYFPVRFKEDFYNLGDDLTDFFVGTILNYGARTNKCLSNISIPEFGEIQDLDLRQFKEWVGSVYKREIDIMEPYMTMSVRLFLSTAGEGLIYGNSVSYSLGFSYDGKNYTIPLKWIQSGTGMQNSPISQQLVDVANDYMRNAINLTNFSKAITAYVQETKEWLIVLDLYNNQTLDALENLTLTKKYKLPSATEKSYSFNQVLLSLNENVAIGSLLTMTISFGDAYEEEEEEEE